MPLSELPQRQLRNLLRDISEGCAALNDDATADEIGRWVVRIKFLWSDLQKAAQYSRDGDLSPDAVDLRKIGGEIESRANPVRRDGCS